MRADGTGDLPAAYAVILRSESRFQISAERGGCSERTVE